jgi:hypothetical protein
MTVNKPSVILRSTLSQLIDHAESNPGEIVSARLTNNLKIDLRVQGGYIQLRVSRSSTWPTEADWRMVLRHWPYAVNAKPHVFEKYGRRYLAARLPLYER